MNQNGWNKKVFNQEVLQAFGHLHESVLYEPHMLGEKLQHAMSYMIYSVQSVSENALYWTSKNLHISNKLPFKDANAKQLHFVNSHPAC